VIPPLIALLGVGVLAIGGASAGVGSDQALEWKHAAPLPVPRSEVAAATVGRELVIVGGFLATGRSSRRVDAYSPARDRWRRLRDLPVAVNHAMAASDGRRLYVVGGYGASTRAFLLSQGRWRRLPDLPEPRAAAGAAIVGRTLYVVGGVTRGGVARVALAFDRTRLRWRRIPGPKPREHLGVSALGGRVYAVAGRETGTNFDTFQAYLPVGRRWVPLPPVPETRGGTDSAAVGRLLVSAGSESARGTSAAVYAFDVRTSRWRRLPDLPTPRHGLGVLGYGGRVYVIGGGPTPGLSVSAANEFLRLR
jgi:N-acetylneuraminic acid mutarotase